jgi:hypothetical protein
MFIWGFCAAVGRLTGTFYAEIGIFNFIHQQIGEFLYRMPQFLLAAMAIIILRETKLIATKNKSVSGFQQVN